VRIALGATAGQVRGLVVRQALVPAALGAVAGVPAAVALGCGAAALLFGVRPFDPFALGGAALLLLGLTILASDAPARRAARVDPCAALREG
jgi:putative ABC transport system permease protein